jgi:hypothetical protein
VATKLNKNSENHGKIVKETVLSINNGSIGKDNPLDIFLTNYRQGSEL